MAQCVWLAEEMTRDFLYSSAEHISGGLMFLVAKHPTCVEVGVWVKPINPPDVNKRPAYWRKRLLPLFFKVRLANEAEMSCLKNWEAGLGVNLIRKSTIRHAYINWETQASKLFLHIPERTKKEILRRKLEHIKRRRNRLTKLSMLTKNVNV